MMPRHSAAPARRAVTKGNSRLLMTNGKLSTAVQDAIEGHPVSHRNPDCQWVGKNSLKGKSTLLLHG
jgi:hypothetical protein